MSETTVKELMETEYWRDKAEGLEYDLDSAIEVMCKRVSGERDVESMGEWLRLNYKHHRHVKRLLPPTMRE